jgi:hypothetical protein
MNYFDNFDNEPLNKYKKILKIKKVYRCFILPFDWWSFKFNAISLLFNSPSRTVKLEPLQNLMAFDGPSNDNEIT